MKFKTILACAVLGLVIFNGRLNAAVESDIVGYTTVTMEAGKWYQIGLPFSQLDGAETFTLDEAFPGFAEGDRLYLSTVEGGYSFRYWKVNASTGAAGWSTSRNTYREDTTEFDHGVAVYIYKETAGTITLSGSVKKVENTFGSNSGNSWNLVALPWPEAKKLSDYTWTGCADGDQLYISTPDGGFSFRYWKVNVSTGAAGWSTSRNTYREDSTLIEPGIAVYINKVSTGIGTVSMQ